MKKRICPKCNEKSPSTTYSCQNCGTSLNGVLAVNVDEMTAKERIAKQRPAVQNRSYCPSCKAPLRNKNSIICSNCGSNVKATTNTFVTNAPQSNSDSNIVVYVISALIPLTGIIIGAIKLGNNDATGKNYILVSVLSTVICTIFALVLSSLI